MTIKVLFASQWVREDCANGLITFFKDQFNLSK